MFEVEGIVMVEALKVPGITPITMKPFMFVIKAVTATEVRPETGDEIVRAGVV